MKFWFKNAFNLKTEAEAATLGYTIAHRMAELSGDNENIILEEVPDSLEVYIHYLDLEAGIQKRLGENEDSGTIDEEDTVLRYLNLAKELLDSVLTNLVAFVEDMTNPNL